MAFHADVLLVDDVQRAKVRESIGATEAIRKGGRIRIAMTCLIHLENDVAAPRKLNGKPGLGLSRIDVTVHRQNAGRRRFCRRSFRHEKERAHDSTVVPHKADIADLYLASGRLDGERDNACGEYYQHPETG